MIEAIEALIALERTGTISEAAAQLRLTQSAVSKRLKALEDDLNFKLIEPDGRRVKLTQEGFDFLLRAKPLIAEFKSLKNLTPQKGTLKPSLGISDSIAASWGPRRIKSALKKTKNLELDLHVHRSTLVEENVKLGKYDLGLCIPSHSSQQNQLTSTLITKEPLVFLYSKFSDESLIETHKILCIEKNSGTWKSLEDKILKNIKIKNAEFIFIESFSAISQMVKEGFGHGIIPQGIIDQQNIPKKAYHYFQPQIQREVHLICRKNILQNEIVREFIDNLVD